MAATNSQVQSIRYSVNWTIKWSEFNKLFPSGRISKIFVTSYNNAPLHWKAELFMPSSDSRGVGFHLNYLNGSIEKFDNMEYAFSIVKPDLSIAKTDKCGGYEALRGIGYGWEEYFDKNPVAFRAKYGLQESHPLIISVTLKIPMSVFNFTPTASPPPTVSPKWADMFANVQDKEKSIGWDVKLISRDGAEFYCHKDVVFQSEPLRNKFHSQAAGNPDNGCKLRLNSTVLKNLLQFLYTGQAALGNLTTKDLIKLAEAAGKYKLKALKEACILVLWKEVKNPKSCGDILHYIYFREVVDGDLKDLKYRAMDVLAENYVSILPNDDGKDDGEDGEDKKFEKFFGEGNGFYKSYLLFLSRRVEPNWTG